MDDGEHRTDNTKWLALLLAMVSTGGSWVGSAMSASAQAERDRGQLQVLADAFSQHRQTEEQRDRDHRETLSRIEAKMADLDARARVLECRTGGLCK